MEKLARHDLMSLEAYAEQRTEFRARVMDHKRHRRVAIGPNLTLYFEDRLTIQYQVQEMLRAERIFEAAGIEEELAAYNPLIPDGRNWKATAMLEFENVELRRKRLAELVGIEHGIWAKIGEQDKITAIANEDLDRSTEDKTSAVHFLRFELSPAMCTGLKQGAVLEMGVDHPAYNERTEVTGEVRAALLGDLDI